MPNTRTLVPTAPMHALLSNPNEWLADSMPDWVSGLSSKQRTALIQAAGPIVPGLAQANVEDRRALKEALSASWKSHHKLEEMLDRLQPIETFAEPLLVAALKKRCNITWDVRETFLRLYRPEGVSVAYRIRTISLLDAALQNFEAKEARPGFFDEASRFITRPSSNGQFDILPLGKTLTVPVFVALCRELDIGGQYQTYLKKFLLPNDPVADSALQDRVQNSDKDALRAAAALARVKGDIGPEAYRVLLDLAGGKTAVDERGNPQYCHDLTLLDTPLTGIVLIGPDLEQSRQVAPILVYIPHDPEHPVKQYSSTVAFLEALTGRLRSTPYQRFFSRFVAQSRRGLFFAALDARLFTTPRQPSTAFASPAPRRKPVPAPKLRMTCRRVAGDIWDHGFEQWRNRIVQDARVIAVPTGDEDLKSRWARWDSVMHVAETVLEMAAFVAVSFVPVLGEAMMAYTVYQLLDETFEGIAAWSVGRRAEAAAHLLGVAENMALLGAFAVGAKVVGAVRSARPSAFVEQMRVVETRPGQSRLWHPDLAPYERTLALDTQARTQANGLYVHQGHEVLVLDGRQFVVEQTPSPGPYRIQHPTRADAYAPRLAHNDAGAWVHEAERPQTWQGTKLMRRLGHHVESFSDETLEQIRIVSGVEEDVLRKLHVEHERPGALLSEMIKRFKSAQDIRQGVEPVDSDAAGAGMVADAQLLHGEFPQLPGAVVDELLVDATSLERRQMSEQRHLPLRLRQAALAALQEWRIVQAYEGLYLPTKGNPDTWRLALHSLAQLPGWPAQVRIEIRDGALEGPLLDSIGPTSASPRKVLAFKEVATAQPFGEQGNSVHGVDDFYTDILQALSEAERRELGYLVSQGPLLSQAIKQTPLDRPAFRDILRDAAVVPAMEPPIVTRLTGGRQGYERVDERLLGTGGALNLEARFKALYPAASAQTYAGFVGSFSSEQMALASLRGRELEFEGLSRALERWVAIERGDSLPIDQRYHKGKLASTLKQCWRAAVDALPEGYTLDLNHHWTSDFLDDFPSLDVSFPHVNAVQWRNGALRTDITGFLGYFPHLKRLDLSHNELVTLPRLQENLAGLQALDLAHNQLSLTPQSIADLGGLSRLEVLKLSHNPALTLLPDISRMPELNVLDLHNTGATDWPPGLLTIGRPRSFELDLQGNPIARMPDVTPGSEQARLIARTRLSRDELPDECLRQFQDYLRSVGYDPMRSYPPKGEETSQYWLEGQGTELRAARQRTWDELEREPGAQGFFEVLEQLTQSADYVDEAFRSSLTARVWRMLDAMAQDTPLREELFRRVINPDSCADAGTQLFNEMGVQVMVHEAYRAGDPVQVQASLLALAKGKSRLDRANEIAHDLILKRLQAGETFTALDEDGEITGTIDEVEVYLAFQTGLAHKLGLPWQSNDMLFRGISGVDDAAITQAYASILEQESGDGLINQIIEQRFWRRYLKTRHASAFEENSATYRQRGEALLDEQLAGTVSQQEYEQKMNALAFARKELLRSLTRQALHEMNPDG